MGAAGRGRVWRRAGVAAAVDASPGRSGARGWSLQELVSPSGGCTAYGSRAGPGGVVDRRGRGATGVSRRRGQGEHTADGGRGRRGFDRS